ncbi:glycosyltransferase family protein [Bacillus sp. UMB0893]|uniref:glycosyltransferase family protein n=1 Tax=Bacillus sp. UMB0893 TaxID=2066053 RepID=UPI000C77C9E5|nr:glycosyltransferase [Bacillus sp. UMB0893]PLR67957.1 hypothetical protein CYJ36_11620 [Bacillus sp. UMB0893]
MKENNSQKYMNSDAKELIWHSRYRWLTKNTDGKSVLYIGSGQMNVPFQLAKEGFYVTGVIGSESELNELKSELKLQNEDVQKRLHFVHKNPIAITGESAKYDTVIISDIFHTMMNRKSFLEMLYHAHSMNGDLIISFPIGIDGSNVVSAYNITSIFKDLQPFVIPEKFTIIDRDIYICSKKRTEVDHTLNGLTDWIDMLESIFYEIEKQNGYVSEIQHDYIKAKQNLDLVLKQLNDLAASSKVDQEEIEKWREREDLLRAQFIVYEKALLEALENREKNLYFLREKLSKIEKSSKVLIGSFIHSSIRNPLKIPRESYNFARAIGGKVKRKMKGQKTKFKLIDLPVENVDIPASPFGLNPVSAKLAKQKDQLNDLFLIGRYDSPKDIKDLRVACILDDFSYHSFKDDCEMIKFRPDNWLEIFTKELPQILFVESAWRGNGGSWQYKIGSYNTEQGNELESLLKYCKENRIPTVFWNKEDPIHFNKFIDTAALFDFIYTTDENCIEMYKKKAKHNRVYALPFAAQPIIHNPIKVPGFKTKNICFAGSYYGNRHEDRRKDQEEILDISRPFGLEIFDRNFNKEQTDELQFPSRFKSHIIGSLPYEKLVRVYKQYKIFINVNSVQDSSTMFSRRVFELLGSGTTVVSTYAKGIKEMFGSTVLMASESTSLESLIEKGMNDVSWREINELKGQRLIFNNHTYAHRLHIIAQNAGFEIEKPYQQNVHVFAFLRNNEGIEHCIEMFCSQSYERKRLTILTYGDHNLENQNKDLEIEVIKLKESDDLGHVIRDNAQDSELLSFFSEENFYGNYFIEDSVHGFIYTNADIVGKSAHYRIDQNERNLINPSNEYIYTNNIADMSFLIKMDAVNRYGVSLSDLVLNKFNPNEYSEYGIRIFSTNKFNYIRDIGKRTLEEHRKFVGNVSK